MVMPLWDDNPFKLPVKPVVTWSLIAVNVLVFVFEIGIGTGDPQDVANNFGLLPSALIGDVSIASAAPPVLTLFTYACHIGGMAAGAVLFPLMRPAWVELFQCIRPPKAPAVAAAADGVGGARFN